MKTIGPIACAVAAVASLHPALAQERPFTPTLSCAAIKSIVARDHDVTLASSPNAYELVHVDSMACASDETSVPAFEPSSDDPNCLAGWRCRQHNSDGNK